MHFILGVEAGEIACSFFCGSFGVLEKKKGASYVLTDVEKRRKEEVQSSSSEVYTVYSMARKSVLLRSKRNAGFASYP